jgi:hypothetical protein
LIEREYNKPPKLTQYNGIIFKSALEARWAVFFDCLGIEYYYEPHFEEVETGCTSVYYKPDFYIPALNKYFEIKPSKPTHEEKVKAAAWTNDICEIVILFKLNPPTEDKENGCVCMIDVKGKPRFFWGYCWGECPKCGHVDFDEMGQVLSCGCYSKEQLGKMYFEEGESSPNFERSKRLLTAYRFANNFKFTKGNTKKAEKLIQFQQSLF